MQGRNLLIYLLYLKLGGAENKNYCRQLASIFGISYSVISRVIKSMTKKAETIERLYDHSMIFQTSKFTMLYYQYYLHLHDFQKNKRHDN